MIEKKLELRNGDLVCFDFGSSTAYKTKKALIDLLNSRQYRVSFVLNKSVKLLIKDEKTNLDTYKCRTAFKLGIPVYHVDLIYNYLLASEKHSIRSSDYLIRNQLIEKAFKSGKISNTKQLKVGSSVSARKEIDAAKIQILTPENDSYQQEFDSQSFELIKWIVFNVNIKFY